MPYYPKQGGSLADADYGDITVSGGATVFTIDPAVVTNAKLATMAASSIKGNDTGAVAGAVDLTATQVRALINVANGATANSSDAVLLARANHTGTQLAATLSDFSTAADARVNAGIATHVGLADPHTQYLTTAEGDAAYAAIGHTHPGLAPVGGTAGQVLKKISAVNYDYSWQADAVGGGGSVAFTAASLTVPYGSLQYAEVNVVDAAITATSKISIGWGSFTDADENTPDMSAVNFHAIAGAGSMTVRVSTTDIYEQLGGIYKINYLIG